MVRSKDKLIPPCNSNHYALKGLGNAAQSSWRPILSVQQNMRECESARERGDGRQISGLSLPQSLKVGGLGQNAVHICLWFYLLHHWSSPGTQMHLHWKANLDKCSCLSFSCISSCSFSLSFIIKQAIFITVPLINDIYFHLLHLFQKEVQVETLHT